MLWRPATEGRWSVPSERRSLPVILVAVAALCSCGCSRERPGPLRVAVQGTVTLDGAPLAQGVVRFVPIEGTPGPKTTVFVTDGKFAADEAHGPVVGRHRIEIESTDDGGYPLDDETAPQRLREAGIKRIDLIRVPEIYNSRSTLVEVVTEAGPNEFQFQLTTPKTSRQ
jgi:hypothetical protein